ncbi:hypothetical protein Q1695_006787 [Nippostrongylus brasiliensis]|nr:hypothetical protein Q1695_006787 [Nippostrongylus brasiliensis]
MRLYRRVTLIVSALCSLAFVANYILRKSNRDELLVEPVVLSADGKRKLDLPAEGECVYDPSCAPPQILFRIHAETANSPPYGCLNDVRLFDGQHLKKGFNLVALNGTNGDVDSVATFDVAASDGEMINWLRALPPSSIIVGVSFGDVAERVSADARGALASFGAVKVVEWRGSSSYAILGQRGLQQHAHELVVPHFDDHSLFKIEGCFDVPLGDVRAINVSHFVPDIQRIDPEKMAALGGGSRVAKEVVVLGPEWKWCGMSAPCSADEISMFFFSGEHKDDHPRLCVGGRMIFDRDLNGAGRGLNLVSIEPKTGRVSSVAHFDTYQDDSYALEEWLENVPLGDIMAVVSFDEASNMQVSQQRFVPTHCMVHRLKFRASWYFVGHKRLAAYTPFEDLNIPSGNNWAKPIKMSLCLPKKLDTWRGRTSNGKGSGYSRRLNLPRRHFCMKHDRHDEFCSENRIDDFIRPKALMDTSRSGDPVFNMPIVIAAGLSTDSLRICLESLMEQEGLNTQMIIVLYDKEYPENADLSSLFHVKSVPVNVSDGYNSLILSALSVGFSLFPSAPALAVIEEDIRLSDDWLYYLSQTVPVLLADPRLDVVQTFNPNGFMDTSADQSQVYRVEFQPPMYSYVIKRKTYVEGIKYTQECCTSPGRWNLRMSASLVPDVSRVTVAYTKLGDAKWTDALFTRDRRSSKGNSVLYDDFKSESVYQSSMTKQVGAAQKASLQTVRCASWRTQLAELVGNSTSVVITCGPETRDIAVAARCFGLYFDEHSTGVYKRVIRFVANSVRVFIVNEMLSKRGSSFAESSANISHS